MLPDIYPWGGVEQRLFTLEYSWLITLERVIVVKLLFCNRPLFYFINQLKVYAAFINSLKVVLMPNILPRGSALERLEIDRLQSF